MYRDFALLPTFIIGRYKGLRVTNFAKKVLYLPNLYQIVLLGSNSALLVKYIISEFGLVFYEDSLSVLYRWSACALTSPWQSRGGGMRADYPFNNIS